MLHVLLSGLLACHGGDSDDSDGEILPAPLVTGAFNTESGGSVASVVAESITPISGMDIWGFEEVENESAAQSYSDAADDFAHITGTTGYQDLLVIAWNDTRYEMTTYEELDDINVGGTARAPLVAHMRARDTGFQFLFMVNHLWRSESDSRHEQAEMLNDWGSEQTLPFVAVGDYNFDWSVENGEDDHDEGYDLLTEDGVFVWVRPDPLVETECSNYNSVLDFIFVSAGPWTGTSEIHEPTNSYCGESDERSDHRPISADLLWTAEL